MADAEAVADASVLEAAVQRGFSTDGEVFDVHHLATLAAEVCGLHAWVLHSTPVAPEAEGAAAGESARRVHSAALGDQIACWLRLGGMAIVPYDKGDANHGPVERGGHAAHYALLVAAAPCVAKSGEEVPPAAAGTVGPAESTWVLVGVHGLSRQPLVMSPDELAASNAQLVSMKPGAGTAAWTVGEAGIRLAGRILLLR